MAKFSYPFVVYPAIEGGYVGEIPGLRGCLSQGETLEGTLAELAEVESLWLETARETGISLPTVDDEIESLKEKLAA